MSQLNKSNFKLARKIHKTLAYILAIQVFLWLLGGFVMSVIPLEKVHGDHLVQKTLVNPFTNKDYQYSLDKLALEHSKMTNIEFSFFLNTPLYAIKSAQGEITINAKSGKVFNFPTQTDIIQQAQQYYRDNNAIKSVTFLTKGPQEAGFKKNIWAVEFDDSVNSTLYFYQNSGKFITVRSDLWRIFDIMWMLHIMDYQDREDFNHPLLIIFAFSAICFSLSGIWLLFQGLTSKRRRLVKRF